MQTIRRLWPALILILILWLPALSPARAGGLPPVTLDGSAAGPVAVEGHVEAFHDTGGTLDFDAVQRIAAQGGFAAVDGLFNPGIDNDGAWWLRFAVRAGGAGSGEWWLAVDAHPLTAAADAWMPAETPDGIRSVQQKSGAGTPLAARALPVLPFVFKAVLAPGEQQVVYVRLAGTRAIRAQLSFWRLPDLVGNTVLVTLVLALILGAAALLGLSAIVTGLWLRERRLVLLGLNTICMMALQTITTGLVCQLLRGLPPAALFSLHSVVLYLTVITLIATVLEIFRNFRAMPLVRAFMAVFMLYAVAGLVVTPFYAYEAFLVPLLVLSVVFCLLVVVASYRFMRAGEPAGIWYFTGFSVFCAVLFAYAARVLGLLPLTALSAWTFPALVLVQIAALFTGITVAMRAGVQARRTLELQLVDALQRSERELEQAVAERTRELEDENRARGEAEAALRQALRVQRNLLSMVSHEFRTPLATISTAVQILRTRFADAASAATYELGMIGRAVGRLGGLIDTFLAEEWLSNVSLQPRLRRTDIRALIDDVVQDAGKESAPRIVVEGAGRPEFVADPMLLRLAIGNLVENALKYSPGPVRVQFATAGESLFVRVADRGPGIDVAEREAIFERYYRSPSQASLPGAGLGLFIVRQIAEIHGGRVTVTATRDGGSLFEIVLPARP